MTKFSPSRLMFAGGRNKALLLALGSAALLAGCHSKPTGQVIATVDGDEITATELNAELQTMQVPPNADKKLVQRQALERIIERKLLANAAREDGIDQNPEFIVRRQQLDDSLLVQMLAKKVAGGIKMPTPGDVDKFVSSNNNMFAGRTIYTVDQIIFDTPARADYLKQLAATHSMPDVVAVLDRLGIKYQRQDAKIDSATVPPQALAQIRNVPAGEPFVAPMGSKVSVSLITGSQPAPLTGDAGRPIAVNAVRNTELGKQLQQRLRSERADAKIQYQAGFGPPPGVPGAAPAAPAK